MSGNFRTPDVKILVAFACVIVIVWHCLLPTAGNQILAYVCHSVGKVKGKHIAPHKVGQVQNHRTSIFNCICRGTAKHRTVHVS